MKKYFRFFYEIVKLLDHFEMREWAQTPKWNDCPLTSWKRLVFSIGRPLFFFENLTIVPYEAVLWWIAIKVSAIRDRGPFLRIAAGSHILLKKWDIWSKMIDRFVDPVGSLSFFGPWGDPEAVFSMLEFMEKK